MQLCEECGAELPDGAQFCGRCGRKVKMEDDINVSTAPATIEDKSLQTPEVSATLHDSQALVLEDENVEKQQMTALASADASEEVEHTSDTTLEKENEGPSNDPTTETSQEQQEHDLISEVETEVLTHHQQSEPMSSISVDADSESSLRNNQFPDEQSVSTETSESLTVTQNPPTSVPKSGPRPASRCLLFSLIGLVIIVGVVALAALFHPNLPEFGGSSNVLSSSSNNDIVDPARSSFTASVCMNSSTPSSTLTSQGSSFALTSSSGCSTIEAFNPDTSCLIFPYGGGNFHKYIVDVTNVSIGNSSYHFVLSVVDYTIPAMFSDAKHISVGVSEGSTGRNFSWLYRSGSVTVDHDMRSGSMNVVLVTGKGGNTLHIVGEWDCGRQIKNQ